MEASVVLFKKKKNNMMESLPWPTESESVRAGCGHVYCIKTVRVISPHLVYVCVSMYVYLILLWNFSNIYKCRIVYEPP